MRKNNKEYLKRKKNVFIFDNIDTDEQCLNWKKIIIGMPKYKKISHYNF